jgi:anti-anti-sigma factor
VPDEHRRRGGAAQLGDAETGRLIGSIGGDLSEAHSLDSPQISAVSGVKSASERSPPTLTPTPCRLSSSEVQRWCSEAFSALAVLGVVMSAPRRIQVSQSGGVSVVTFRDSKIIDELAISELGQELNALVEVDARKKIVLNFSNVEFLSSAALGKLIGFEKKVKNTKAELMLTNIRPEIYEVFAITKLTKLFTIKDDEADALAVL